MTNKMIGIVGGVGSFAAIDLIKKIYESTEVSCDQEHLPVLMLSLPNKIVDRTKFLLGEININPGYAISEIINFLTLNGAEVIGIPCNTAHANPIFDIIKENISASCILVHLVEEVGYYLNKNHPEIECVGVLGTNGTMFSGIYPETLIKYGINVIQPAEKIQNHLVQPAIYDMYYGIKAHSNPVRKRAKKDLFSAAVYLSQNGAQAIILGCSEIPLAITERKIGNSIIIDSTSVLASALIREALEKNHNSS
jgi:aspartate racemase